MISGFAVCGGEMVNRKCLVVTFAVLAAVLLTTPLVFAVPGSEKQNEKFVSFEINKIGGPPVGPVVVIEHPAPPAEPQFRRVIVPEGMVFANIIVDGGAPYVLGVDFTYQSTLTLDFHLNSDPLVAGCIVEVVYAFLPASGIDGSLVVRTVGKFWPNGLDGASAVYSYGSSVGHGTGGLEGVLIKTVGWHTSTGLIHHEGYVTNWPT